MARVITATLFALSVGKGRGGDMQTCDICGKQTADLVSLKSVYQTDDIKEICSDCQVTVNNQLDKLFKITFKTNQHWLKTFMMNLAKGFAG